MLTLHEIKNKNNLSFIHSILCLFSSIYTSRKGKKQNKKESRKPTNSLHFFTFKIKGVYFSFFTSPNAFTDIILKR